MTRSLVGWILLGACAQGPARIEVQDQVLITELSPQTLDARALSSDGELLPSFQVLPSQVSDPEVLALGKDGRVQCKKTGDVDLTLTAGTIHRAVKVSCVLVKEIRVSPRGLLGVLVPGADGALHAEAAPTLSIEVIDSEGKVNTSIPVDIRAVDPAVVTVDKDRKVSFLTRGRTDLRLLAGGKTLGMPVEVHEEVLRRQDLVIKPRENFGSPLPPGAYRATVGSDQPVVISFAGTDCETDKGADLDLECVLEKTAVVEVENAPGFSLGKTANVKLRVVKLPDIAPR